MSDKSASTTKLIIASSFEALLEKNSFQNITVKAIMEECKMSRRTFYKYFLDVYDLVDWMIIYYAGRVSKETFIENKDFRESFQIALRSFLEHRKFYRAVAGTAGKSIFMETYSSYLISEAQQHVGLKNLSQELNVALRVYWVGVTNELMLWINDGMKQDIEELSNSLYECLPVSLKKFWF